MRMITIPAAGIALALAMATGAQAQSTQAQSTQAQSTQAQTTQAPTQPPAESAQPPAAAQPDITSVTIVDIAELPEATQQQVNEVVAQGGDEQLERLRASVDGMPQLKSALEEKGLTSAQVIAASMGEGGALTLITKKAS